MLCSFVVGYQRFRDSCTTKISVSYHNITWRHNPEKL